MTLWQALAYFLREATVSLLRSWKVSLLAVVTIAVSLYVGGGVALIGSNLAELTRGWRQQARVVLYLDADASPEDRAGLVAEAEAQGWASSVDEIGATEAARRFRTTFPSLAELVDDGHGDAGAALPPSLELALAPAADEAEVGAWADRMREHPAVDMVDDDRDWLRQMETLTTLVRGAGLTLGAVLLTAAIFTIASVIRLTAFLYHEEIAVMRLVGATEFFIRGPFYAEGVLQGLLGGAVALGGLWLTWALAGGDDAGGGLLDQLLTAGFLDWKWSLGLVALGAAAGLFGAVASLRREQLDRVAEVGEPAT